MKIKVVGKNGKYRKRFSLDIEDWITIVVVILVLCFVLIQFLLGG